jgi:predicted glycogen debranching enzyme
MKLPSMIFNDKMLSQFDDATQKEWIVTNGLGGYASSTVLGINTRKYHGLLVAAFHPPGDRRVCLAKLDEEVSIGKDTYPLGANEFQNGVFPQGYRSLKEFSLSPFPKYVYSVENVKVEKTIFMPFEKNAVIALYNILNKSGFDIKIRIFPLVNWRHFHSVTDRWKVPWEFVQGRDEKKSDISFGTPQSALMMKVTNGHYHADGKWVERIYYREEAVRGESCLDDCYQLGFFEVDVKASKNENFAVTTVGDENELEAHKVSVEIPNTVYGLEALFELEMKRRENFLANFYGKHENVSVGDWLNWIILAADIFIVKGVDDLQKSVIAGYHWFEAWGRDTFISLPGLMLVTGRFEDARKVFLSFKKHCNQGLIPNFIPDQFGPPAYNSVDATLWFANAVLQYLKHTNDFDFVREQLWETLKIIVENYVKGTALNIYVDDDCLLSCDPLLTWMDAAVDGQPVTPRAGKPVEVQALWFNTLRIMELLASKFNERSEAEKYSQMAENTRKTFVEKFWDSEKNYLFDVVNEHNKDDSLRPNQIIAVALDFSMLDNSRNEKIVDIVHRELSAPYGLRSLARNDPKYVGVYSGDRRSRDKAYHNGTVWPWLQGPFTTAFLKAKGYADCRREYALKNFILPLFTEQIFKVGLGTISEILDGEQPHRPRGCISQAWSVAEPLRAYVEDVMRIRPKYEKEILQSLR